MVKKKVEKSSNRLGKDPFKEVDWIGKKAEESKSDKQSNLSKQSKSKVQTTPSEIVVPEELSLKPNSERIPENTSSRPSPQEPPKPEAISSSKAGLKEGWTRGTYIIQEKWLETIKDYAYWERLEIKEALDFVLEQFFKDKKVQPRPKKNLP